MKYHIKPKFLGKEFDVVGVFGRDVVDEITIVESKGKSSTEEDLQRELNEFEGKVDSIRNNPKLFVEILGYQSNEFANVKGVFVSMADVQPDSVVVPGSVEFWDFSKFQDELRKVHLPAEYRRLLKKVILIRTFSLDSSIFNLM